MSTLMAELEQETSKVEQEIKATWNAELNSLKQSLSDLQKSALFTIRQDIESEIENLQENLQRAWKYRGISSLIVGLCLCLGMFLGSLILTRQITSQIQTISNNNFEISAQEESLKRGRFFKNPENGRRYVNIVPGSQYQARSGKFWAEMKLN